MVSTLAILCACLLSLLLVWAIVRPRLPQIRTLDDWEAKKYEVDLEAFRILLDPAEEQYLRRKLPPAEFRHFQKQRLALALRSLDLVGKNAAMLLKLGQLARESANPALAKEAEDLIYGALRLRVNLLHVQPYLWLKWIFPGWTLSVPAFAMPYEELLSYLSRVRQQRQWELKQAVIAS
jgi:hypothetical protein